MSVAAIVPPSGSSEGEHPNLAGGSVKAQRDEHHETGALEIRLTPVVQRMAGWPPVPVFRNSFTMHARPSPLFDTSRSALLLRVGPGSRPAPVPPPTYQPNTMRANDLPTDGPDREPAKWMA
jgi:hypothetical protein